MESGIPAGLIGYEYLPLPQAEFIDGTRQGGLVSVATSGLFGRICVDALTGEVAHIPMVDYPVATHVNKDIPSFTQCVSAVIARFPFYEEDDEESKFEEVADEIRKIITGIDDTAFADDGFWETMCDDVAMGGYSNWDD